MQHIRIGAEMKDDVNGSQLSDNLPIHVDFNLAAPQCTPDLSSPWGPQIVTLDTQSADAVYASKEGAVIAHPGNMQWYYIPDTGTYWIQSFNVGATVAFDVYEEDDLSNPIQPYHGEVDPEQGKHYVATRPLYVRVYAVHPDGTPDRPWRLGLSAVIEALNGEKSYWALAHPPEKPDFHHPDSFTLDLSAESA